MTRFKTKNDYKFGHRQEKFQLRIRDIEDCVKVLQSKTGGGGNWIFDRIIRPFKKVELSEISNYIRI